MQSALPDQITFNNARQVLATVLKTCPHEGQLWAIDGALLAHFDSSALSVCVSLLRHAVQHKVTIEWQHMPTTLLQLASIYGIAELFNFPQAQQHGR